MSMPAALNEVADGADTCVDSPSSNTFDSDIAVLKQAMAAVQSAVHPSDASSTAAVNGSHAGTSHSFPSNGHTAAETAELDEPMDTTATVTVLHHRHLPPPPHCFPPPPPFPHYYRPPFMYPNGLPPPPSNDFPTPPPPPPPAANRGYAGFSTPAQEPRPFIGPQLPEDYKEQKKKQLAQQPLRVPSPVPTEARERLLQIQELVYAKKPPKLGGIGRLIAGLRKEHTTSGTAVENANAASSTSVWTQPSGQKVPAEVDRRKTTQLSSGGDEIDLTTTLEPANTLEEGVTMNADGPILEAVSERHDDKPTSAAASVVSSEAAPAGALPATEVEKTAVSAGVARSVIPAPPPTRTVRFVPYPELMGPDDVPAAPPHPVDPDEIRKLIRSKMHRCKRCKNRFVERYLLEVHLKKSHNDDYLIYMAEQEAEMDAQRREEMEQMRIEEIQCGGFIPPASEVDSANFDVDPEK